MKKHSAGKIGAGILTACMLISASTAVSMPAKAAETVYGDATLDGDVTIADALAILQYIANSKKYGLSAEALDNADVYNRGDGITAMDALSIQKLDAKVISSLPESWAEVSVQPTQPVTQAPTAAPTEAPTEAPTAAPVPVEEVETYIHLKNSSISVEGKYAEANGTKVTISHSGSYYIDGTLDNGQIYVEVPDEKADNGTVKLIFKGVNITGKNAPAVFVKNADKTSITLEDGTKNVLSDGETPYDGDFLDNAIIEAKDDLTIKGGDQGTGTLEITANHQTAVVSNNDIKITGGVITINTLDAENGNDAIKGKQSVTVKGGTINIDAEGDGIKSSKGNVDIEGGNVNIKSGSDAIQGETAINILGGNIIACGDEGLTCEVEVNISGGELLATATDNQLATFTNITQPTIVLDYVKEWSKNNPITLTNGGTTVFEANTPKKFSYALVSSAGFDQSSGYTLYTGGIQCSAAEGNSFKGGSPAKYTQVNNTEDGDLLYGDLFAKTNVHKIDIQMSESQWQDLIKNAESEEYYPCDIVIDGEKIENAAVRTKGNSSRMMVSSSGRDKYSLRVKLDKYDKMNNYHGLTEFCMNNMFGDPSCMRDVLCYDALAEINGVGPNCAYTDMYLNGQLYSFYFLAEQPGTTLAERYAVDNDSVLYKATDKAGNGGGMGGMGGTGYCSFAENMALDNFDVKFGMDDSYKHIGDIKTAINQLSSSNYKFIEDYIDVPSFLKGFAVNSVMCNYDSYNGTLAHNYYLMYTGGKAYFVGWDYNLSMGNFMDGGSSVNSDVTTSLYQVTVSDRPLAKLLQVPEYYDMYKEYVKTIYDMYSNPGTAINKYASIIRDHVKADPRFFFTVDQFESNISKSATGLSTGNNNNSNPWGQQGNNNPWGQQGNDNPWGQQQQNPWGQQGNDNPWGGWNFGGNAGGNANGTEGGNGGWGMMGMFGDAVGMFGGQNVSIYDFLEKRMEIIRDAMNF